MTETTTWIVLDFTGYISGQSELPQCKTPVFIIIIIIIIIIIYTFV